MIKPLFPLSETEKEDLKQWLENLNNKYSEDSCIKIYFENLSSRVPNGIFIEQKYDKTKERYVSGVKIKITQEFCQTLLHLLSVYLKYCEDNNIQEALADSPTDPLGCMYTIKDWKEMLNEYG